MNERVRCGGRTAENRCTWCLHYRDAVNVYGQWREASCGFFAMPIDDPTLTCSFWKERLPENAEGATND